jgi:hypothetical protein
MGWSCTKAASQAMERLTAQCVRKTGSQNRFPITRTRLGFWEHDLVEYDDGHITGEWFMEVGPDRCCKGGDFIISPGGVMSGGHPWMRMMCR